jgi:hypothetical protein
MTVTAFMTKEPSYQSWQCIRPRRTSKNENVMKTWTQLLETMTKLFLTWFNQGGEVVDGIGSLFGYHHTIIKPKRRLISRKYDESNPADHSSGSDPSLVTVLVDKVPQVGEQFCRSQREQLCVGGK